MSHASSGYPLVFSSNSLTRANLKWRMSSRTLAAFSHYQSSVFFTSFSTRASSSTCTKPVSIIVDPTGHYVYVANATDATISQYLIGGIGTLVPMPVPTVAAGPAVSALTIDPTGTFLYATNRGTATISQFKIGPNGSLTPMATPTVPSGLHPTAIATGY